MVYDITKANSFKVLKDWLEELKNSAPPGIIIAIVGNKIDLIEQQEVDYQDASNYAKVRKPFWILIRLSRF